MLILKKLNFLKCNFWIKSGFLPQCETQWFVVGCMTRHIQLFTLYSLEFLGQVHLKVKFKKYGCSLCLGRFISSVGVGCHQFQGLIDTYVLFHGTVQRKLGDNMTLEQFLMMGSVHLMVELAHHANQQLSLLSKSVLPDTLENN